MLRFLFLRVEFIIFFCPYAKIYLIMNAILFLLGVDIIFFVMMLSFLMVFQELLQQLMSSRLVMGST